MLARFLDWLDEAAGGLIRITYLLAGITAVAVYFGAGHLPAIVEAPLNAALPWLLGFSLETHTYLTARRVRAAWQDPTAPRCGSTLGCSQACWRSARGTSCSTCRSRGSRPPQAHSRCLPGSPMRCVR